MAANETPRAPVPLTGEEEAFIRAFARASLTLPRALDADLVREQRLTLTEYFALMHLSEAPDRRLRMSDIAAAAALSLSGMTRIIDRLASLGLVRRERPEDDGRGWHAVLTDAGLERLREAWPTHLASTRRHMFDHLSAVDLSAFTEALRRFADAEAGAPLCEPLPGCDEG